MPGIPFHVQALRKTIAALQAQGDPRGDVMAAHPTFAHLGALGPDLLKYDYIRDQGLLGQVAEVLGGTKDVDDLADVDKLQLQRRLLMIGYRTLFERFRELWPVLDEIHGFLDEMDGIVAAEDLGALQSKSDEAEALQDNLAPLTGVGDGASQIYAAFKQIITLFRPMIQSESGSANPVQTQPLTWRPEEYLRWRGSGALARSLVSLAESAPPGEERDQQRAFAYGWLCHVATQVTSEPFVNDIVGGPYRTHWWRNRLVANYVDGWTWGFYETPGASMAGDEPTPAYADWTDLCGAHLEGAIAMDPALGGLEAMDGVVAGTLPEDGLPEMLAELLAKAVEQTYEGALKPLPPGGFSAEVFRGAYAGAVAVLHFATGGNRPMCLEPPGPPPGDCTDPPDWVTSGGSPPSSNPDEFEDSSKTATKIILAILAILSFLGGALGSGIASLIVAINTDPAEWGKLRCHLYWIRFFLFQQEKAIRDILVWATMIYPAAEDLGGPAPTGDTVPAEDVSGRTLFKSVAKGDFPRMMDADTDAPPDVNFVRYPPSEQESPGTFGWPLHGVYPDVPMEGASWVPTPDDMTVNDPSNFPVKLAAGDDGPIYFGNSVVNAVAVITTGGEGLVNYNLDGDRGYGWFEWAHPLGEFPSAPPVNAEPV